MDTYIKYIKHLLNKIDYPQSVKRVFQLKHTHMIEKINTSNGFFQDITRKFEDVVKNLVNIHKTFAILQRITKFVVDEKLYEESIIANLTTDERQDFECFSKLQMKSYSQFDSRLFFEKHHVYDLFTKLNDINFEKSKIKTVMNMVNENFEMITSYLRNIENVQMSSGRFHFMINDMNNRITLIIKHVTPDEIKNSMLNMSIDTTNIFQISKFTSTISIFKEIVQMFVIPVNETQNLALDLLLNNTFYFNYLFETPFDREAFSEQFVSDIPVLANVCEILRPNLAYLNYDNLLQEFIDTFTEQTEILIRPFHDILSSDDPVI